ncbi:MAG TPA: methyltransferase domain-containing protein [Actinomycetes bacterium]|nr:methyltransferase domain-containing protein [Actinomycetes bacterium]
MTGRPDPVAYLGEVARSAQGRDYKAAVVESLELAPGLVVLDVGCGPGTDLAAMAGLVAPDGVVIGVDNDERMVNEAAQRTADLPGVEVRRGDAHALPLADASVDRARTDRLLQHVADPGAAAADIARVLRPGGVVAFAEPDWGTLVIDAGDDIGRSVSRAFVHWTCEQVVRNATVGRSLARHASGAGLSVRAVSAYPSVWTTFETADRVLGLTRNSASAVDGGYLDGADRDAWLTGLAAGPVVAAVSLFVVAAVKPVTPV